MGPKWPFSFNVRERNLHGPLSTAIYMHPVSKEKFEVLDNFDIRYLKNETRYLYSVNCVLILYLQGVSKKAQSKFKAL
jgi:hypothetical protein